MGGGRTAKIKQKFEEKWEQKWVSVPKNKTQKLNTQVLEVLHDEHRRLCFALW